MDLSYLLGRKEEIDFSCGGGKAWDLFLSAYNDSRRVRDIFSKADSKQKIWIILPEYAYRDDEMPKSGQFFCCNSRDESEVITTLFAGIGVENIRHKRICIDITGFMRPHILFLIFYLKQLGVYCFDVIYTEPAQYGKKEDTKFSNEVVVAVRQVLGYEGLHTDVLTSDVLIVGVGYDDVLISRVQNDKEGAKLIQLLSLPSLSADMYQESILRLEKTFLNSNYNIDERIFHAPANDPFVVATELSSKIKELRARGSVGNIYLSPLATKPQALGFGLFFLKELVSSPASIIFPFSESYTRETSSGVGRTWLYEVNLE